MAKKSSAERVGPITRANYSGHGDSDPARFEDDYDPLTALANIVGNSGSAEPTKTPHGELEMEAELFASLPAQATFTANENVPVPMDTGSVSESNKVAPAAQSRPQFEESPPTDGSGLMADSNDEPAYATPVLQSFEELHSAFNSEPQVEPESSNEIAGSGHSDELVHPESTGFTGSFESVDDTIADADPVLEDEVPNTITQYDAPSEHIQPADDMQTEYQTDIVSDPESDATEIPQSVEVSTDRLQFDVSHATEPPIPGPGVEAALDDAIATEFEAALAEIPVSTPDAVTQVPTDDVRQAIAVEAPHDSEAELTLPPIDTPFDQQVDTALDELQRDGQSADSELGWSGELAGELEQIVATSMGVPDEDSTTGLPVGESTVEPSSTDNTESSASLPPAEIQAHMQAFEQEFVGQIDMSNEHGEIAADRETPPVIPDTVSFEPEAGGRRGGMRIAAVVLGLAVIAGGSAFGLGYFGKGSQVAAPAKIIMASTDPVKIKPKEPGGKKILNQNQVVFEKVQGKSEEKATQVKLNSAAEKPIRVVSTNTSRSAKTADTAASPPAKSSARITADDGALTRTENALISPRKVRTVIVRPDGTIVASSSKKSATKVAMAAPKPEKLDVTPETAKPAVVKKIAVRTIDSGQKKSGEPVAGAARAIKVETDKASTASVNKKPKLDLIDGGSPASGKIPAPASNPAPKPVVIAKAVVEPKKTAPRKVVRKPAKIATKKPVTKTVRKPAAKPVVKTASAGSYVMQVSSQRSAKAAQSSYNRLNKRFNSILGGRGVDIRRFNLKKKGIYYRVRIPVGTKKAAVNLCQRYKKAGGSCFVTR